jgi:transcriptional regulator with XRE-family HTH domain
VRELRKWRGLSQEQLADAAGVSQSYIAGIEKGRRAGTLATLRAIAAALGVSVENFT